MTDHKCFDCKYVAPEKEFYSINDSETDSTNLEENWTCPECGSVKICEIVEMKRDDVIQFLIDRDMDALDDHCWGNVLLEGCRGYEQIPNDELIEIYQEATDEAIIITDKDVEVPKPIWANKLLYIVWFQDQYETTVCVESDTVPDEAIIRKMALEYINEEDNSFEFTDNDIVMVYPLQGELIVEIFRNAEKI